jgi:SAM-dependent methyltransferase
MHRPGTEFGDDEVVRSYAHRAPYPPELYARLLEIAPGRGRALDLGCGPGKLAGGLAPHFDEVVAVDPSAAMLEIARTLNPAANISWIHAFFEDVRPEGHFDVAVAGASIHWMDPGVVFPRLADLLTGAPIAVLGGDGPAEAEWMAAYQAVNIRWVERLGGVWNSPEFVAHAHRHEAWIDVAGRETVEGDCVMAVEDLIDGEHSRATWTRAKMGELAEAFDADLRAVLAPHARDGRVSFRTRTALLWGRPRRTPKPD